MHACGGLNTRTREEKIFRENNTDSFTSKYAGTHTAPFSNLNLENYAENS